MKLANCKFVGIDPGKNGGISSVLSDGDGNVDWASFRCVSMPVEADKVLNEMRWHFVQIEGQQMIRISSVSNQKTYILIEKLTGFTRASGPDTMFKLGIEFGKVKCLAELLEAEDKNVRLEYAPPQTWQKLVTSYKRKDFSSDTQWKNHLKDRATLLLDGRVHGLKPTLKTADSILILYYLLTQRGLL